MLIGFIGSPCSGKTTTAARLFAELKENGQPSEYIAEKARTYIAEKKFLLKASGSETKFSLTDEDQQAIAHSQYRSELVLNEQNLIVVTDSCVLNSLLYMTPSMRESAAIQSLAKQATAKYDILFICSPVPRPASYDPNRVHDEAASMLIHQSIETVIQPFYKDKETHVLAGPSHLRVQQAFSAVLALYAARQ